MDDQALLQHYSEAENNERETRALCMAVKVNFIKIGMLLNDSVEECFWSQCGHENFSEYVESLGAGSYSWGTRLMRMATLVQEGILNTSEALEIGVSKMAALLPHVEDDNFQDLKELAKVAPYRDLREELGHKKVELDTEIFITCNRCGAKIVGAKFVRRGK